MNKPVYFAADEAEVCVETLIDKSSTWFNTLVHNNYIDKLKRSWNAYHGSYFDASHQVGFGGEMGELVHLAVNHYRNIARHQLNMTTSNRPSFQARSVNTDSKSQIQTTLANGLLEYYMREKRLEVFLKTAVEHAIVMGSGYVKMEWNSTSGEIHDYIFPEKKEDSEDDEEISPYPIYEGDVQFSNLSPLDVVFDGSKESTENHDWVLCRTFKNKFDLAAKYPELESKILGVKSKSDQEKHRVTLSALDETVDVPVYEFFHKKTESMPNGRYLLYLDGDIILMDSPMPYRKLPIYRIAPSDILGTPYGYTTMFDLLPLQDAVNTMYSTAFTNQSSYGVQNVLNPMGNNVKSTQLENGMNFIEYNGQVGKPEALNLTNTPPEIFNFLQMLERAMETISGINSVARGNPESSLKSGNALALVQAQALQFISGLQHSYIQMIEDIGTGLIQLLQDFAEVPRIAEISGIANKSKMAKFKGDDLDSINRVVVDAGNALAQSAAGRAEMADNLIQMGLINKPEEYFSVINTGRLENMTEGHINQNLLIRTENERLIDGTVEVLAIDTDAHSQHIREHRDILNDPDARIKDPSFVERTLVHIQQHIEALRNVDPDLLAMLGEQPLSPPGGTPINPETGQPDMPNAEGVAQPMMNPEAGGPPAPSSSAGMPKIASPAKSPDGNPVLASDIPLTR